MQTTLSANSHGNSANIDASTNDHCHQTPKDTAVPVADHIVNTAHRTLFKSPHTISEQYNSIYNVGLFAFLLHERYSLFSLFINRMSMSPNSNEMCSELNLYMNTSIRVRKF